MSLIFYNISMAQELRSLNPQGLVELIDHLSKNLSIPKLISSNSLHQLNTTVQNLEKLSHLLPDGSRIIGNLKSYLTCCNCKRELPDLSLNCRHNLCKQCLIDIVFEYTTGRICLNENEKASTPLCPDCQTQIGENEYSKFFQNWGELKKNALVRQELEEGVRVCTQCKKSLSLESYYNIELCHSLCKKCIWCKVIERQDNCSECENYINFADIGRVIGNFECFKCQKGLNIYSACYACSSHPYCFQCCTVVMAQFRCIGCESELNIEDYDVSIKCMHDNCSFCNYTKERPLFVKKNCCKKSVCLDCQMRYSMNMCKSCKNQLVIE